MEELIRNLKLTKQNSKEEIEKQLLDVQDFSRNYYLLKNMNTSYWEAAEKIFEELQNT